MFFMLRIFCQEHDNYCGGNHHKSVTQYPVVLRQDSKEDSEYWYMEKIETE